MGKKTKITYKDSGVDIKAGEQLVDSIKNMVNETHSGAVLNEIGSFGGFYQADFNHMSDPVLVSSVDGVGTKLIVTFKAGIYDTIGQDLVNHCTNDIAVCGAKPLFFLDYFSTGTLEQHVGYEVIKGFSYACKQSGIALIGGETAEMPDIYKKGEFDLAGTIVGVVDRREIIDGHSITEGNLLVGISSSGLHTNGYSLARKVLFNHYDIDDYLPETESTVGEELLKIHTSYLPLISATRKLEGVNGFAHITGGGIIGNTKRIVPDGYGLKLDWNSWERPPIFNLIQELGNVPEEDMQATFNLGIGLVAVVDPKAYSSFKEKALSLDSEPRIIGEIVQS